jgi:hypothetical protein
MAEGSHPRESKEQGSCSDEQLISGILQITINLTLISTPLPEKRILLGRLNSLPSRTRLLAVQV